MCLMNRKQVDLVGRSKDVEQLFHYQRSLEQRPGITRRRPAPRNCYTTADGQNIPVIEPKHS